MNEVTHPTMARGIALANHYHQWVFDSFRAFLNHGGLTLEVGAGHGGYTKLLLPISKKVIATDVDDAALFKIKNDLALHDNLEVLRMEGVDRRMISDPLSNIVAINILEHIEDDRSFLRESFSMLGEGGKLIMLVPAFQFLFSNIDKQAGHHRRYGKAELESFFTEHGFSIASSRYFNFIGFFGWLVNKWFSSGVDSRATNFQVAAFDRFVPIFKRLDRLFPLCGQSLLIVGEKMVGNKRNCNDCGLHAKGEMRDK